MRYLWYFMEEFMGIFHAECSEIIPSGKRLHSCRESPCFMDKSTTSMAFFNSYSDITRGYNQQRDIFACLEKRKNHPPSDGNFHRENAVLRSIGFGGSPRLFWKKPSKATGFYQLAYHPIKLQTYHLVI